MAWRDTRTSRRRLLLYTASITLGIAALVSIASLGESLRQTVRSQSVALLGADLVAESGDPFVEEAEAWFTSLGGEQAREQAFSSMILFPRTGSSRLVSVRAIEDGFPFYGDFKTKPESAGTSFRAGREVLVEENVMLAFGAQVGDELRIGTSTFTIAGAMVSVPGESPGFNLVAPRVYMPMRFLEETGLTQRGSRVRHRVYFAFGETFDVDALRNENREQLREWRVRTQTVASRERNLGGAVDNLERFLGVVGFVALLLGAVGVASGIHVFVRQKLGSIAVLRCVGATSRQTLAIYLVQAAGLGVIGAAAGAVLGLGIQFSLPAILGDALPPEVELRPSWAAVGQGFAAGVGVTLALAALPLLAVRRISPLLALRSTIEPPRRTWRDPATILVVATALAAITGFAMQNAAEWQHGVGFVVGTGVVFLVLVLLGLGMMRAARRFMPAGAPYVWRQGLANLFRPNNRTLLVILALGLGSFLIVTMQLTQGLLVGQLEVSKDENRSNVIMFDIQSDQRESMRELVAGLDLPVMDEAPIVTMRIASVNGETVQQLREDRTRDIPRWVLNREYRSSYRESTNDAERITAGSWIGRVEPGTEVVPISLEEGIAADLRVKVGDRIVFDVQGVPMECEVASIRAVETRRFQPFFFVLFPAGVLEDAPQFAIMTTHVRDSAESARLQNTIFERHPNVSVVDLMLILETVDAIFDRVAFVFRFMAVFVLGTGLIVLAGVMASGRFQRLRESVLLRTIGASRRQIARIQLVEYLLLGTFASLAGVSLAWFGAWALGHWVFELEVLPAVTPLVTAWLFVSSLTIVTGWLSGRRALDHPPLELLRQEV
jgi:putative ABC transport system permease protein